MSQKAKRKKTKAKKALYKDKLWFDVLASKSFNFKSIGEVIGLENNIVGRVLEALLFDFTGDFNDISLKLKFKITDVNVEGKKCNSIFMGHQYTNDFVRSLIGRGASKIATIENLTTKDNYKFRVTTICTTIRRARSSQQEIIRKIMKDILNEFAQLYNHEKFIHGMIYGEFQNQIGRVAKTIYPLANATIIKSKLTSIPEGGQDKEIPDGKFDIVEVEVKRSRKSDIKRTERINVKKFPKAPSSQPKSKEEDIDEESDISDESEDA